MLIIGLTGSIGMGKTTAAAHFAARGLPVLDSDRVVHQLYAGEAVPLIEAVFPGITANGTVDRSKLGEAVMRSADAFGKLEAIVHPLVRKAQWQFLRKHHAAGAGMVLLDVPLLFETGYNNFADVCVVVSAPKELQRERVMPRPGMTAEKLNAILARQIPDVEKRARADFVIDTSGAVEETYGHIDRLIESMKACESGAFERWRARYE